MGNSFRPGYLTRQILTSASTRQLEFSRTKETAFSSLYSIHEVAGRANDKEVSDVLNLFVSIIFLALASLQAQGADDPKSKRPAYWTLA
jgi:hypothetical protein